MNNYYIYLHINLITGEPFYVGKGKNKRAFSKNKRSKWWHHIVDKHGYDIIFLETNLTVTQAWYDEMYWIKRIGRKDLNKGPLVNLTDGGEGSLNYKHNEEAMKNIMDFVNRRDYYGSKNPNYNNKWSIEKRNTLSEKLKYRDYNGSKNPFYGKDHSDEFKKSVSDRLKGVPLKSEHRKKISDANKGRKWYNNGTISKMFKNDEIEYGFVEGRLPNKKKIND
jgi:hypothetical protein